MEILFVYLYGIYDSIDILIIMSATIATIVSIISTIISFIAKDTSSFFIEDSEEYKEYVTKSDIAKKFIFIKTSIFLIIISVLFPPKEIAVAMLFAPKVVEIAKDIADSNRTIKIVNIIDLSIDRIADKLKDK